MLELLPQMICIYNFLDKDKDNYEHNNNDYDENNNKYADII